MYNYGPGKAWKTPGIFFSYFVVMKRHKAPGLSRLTAEMIQGAKGIGTQWLLDLCSGIVKRLHSRGLEVKCDITHLQRER